MAFLEIAPFCFIKNGKVRILVKEDYRDILLEMGIENPMEMIRSHGANVNFYKGRGMLAAMDIPGQEGKRMVIKHCSRGGPVQFFTKDLFLDRYRPFQEMLLNYLVQKNNIATAEIIAVHVRRFLGIFYRADIISLEIPHSFNLYTCLSGWGRQLSQNQVVEKHEIIKTVAHLIKNMHEAGIYHRDLNIKNILIQKRDGQLPHAFVIDLDRARVVNKMSFRMRMKNLLRLHRSLVKLGLSGAVITRTDTIRFFKEYMGDSPNLYMISPYLKRYDLSLKLHKLWWAFHNYLRR